MVSVIITCHKPSPMIGRAIQSALNQKLATEIIIAQDGNFDLSVSYTTTRDFDDEPRTVHGNFKSLSKNFNNALQHATQPYVKILPYDDELPEHSLAQLVKTAKETKADLVHGWAIQKYNTGQVNFYSPANKYPTLADLVAKNHIHGSTCLYKTSKLKEIGGMNETCWTGEEFEMHMHLLKEGAKIAYCPYPTGIYHIHGANKHRIDKPRRKKFIDQVRRWYA